MNTKKVKNGSLLSKDFKAGQLPAGATGPQGLQGPQGDKGENGEKGDKGDPGLDAFGTLTYRRSDAVTVTSGAHHQTYVPCPDGTRPIGGGVDVTTVGVEVMLSAPARGVGLHTGTPTGWDAGVNNNSGAGTQFRTYVICAASQAADVNY